MKGSMDPALTELQRSLKKIQLILINCMLGQSPTQLKKIKSRKQHKTHNFIWHLIKNHQAWKNAKNMTHNQEEQDRKKINL